MNRRRNRLGCLFLALVFVISNLMTSFAYETKDETDGIASESTQSTVAEMSSESEQQVPTASPEPTEEIQPDISENTAEFPEATDIPEEPETTPETTEENSIEENILCTKTTGCILPDGHEGDCFIPCTITEGCNLPDGHEGDCFIPCTKTTGCKYADGHEGDCFVPCTLSENCILQNGHDGDCVFEQDTTLPYDLTGMPDGYVLTDSELEQKEAISEKEIEEQIGSAVASEDYVQDQVVLLTDSEEKAQMVAQAYNGELKEYTDGVAVVELSDISVEQAIEVAGDTENNIPAVYPNYIYTLSPVPSRPKTTLSSAKATTTVPKQKSWVDFKDSDPALSTPTSSTYQWHHDMINSYEAWSTADGEGVKVAVLDTGVKTDHEDLSGRCQVIDMVGVDGIKSNEDTTGHGTHVAGIIGATLGNSKGGAGVAPKVTIYSVCVIPDGYGTTAAITIGIQRAVNKGVDIINMSLGSYFYDATENQAIQNAINHGITVVAAMGNDGSNTVNYPAAYDNVIGVAAVDRNGYRASYSNYGSWADIAAPGTEIYSTYNDGSYETMDGTSMAAPMVTGVLALYMSKVGHVSPSAALKKLKSCVTKSPSSGIGAGIVDASKLFSTVKTKPVISVQYNGTAISNLKGTIPYEATIQIEADSSADNGAMIVYTLDGKNPTIKDGEVTYGNVYDSQTPVSLESYKGKKVTIKAVCISDMGTVSDMASQAISVSSVPVPTELSLQVGNSVLSDDTLYLCAGKAFQFGLQTTPEKALSGYTWSVEKSGYTSGVTIDQKGKLSSKITDNGSVTVKVCSSVNQNVYKTITVKYESDFRPLKSLSLNLTKATVGVGVGSIQLIPTLLDTWNCDRSTDSRNLIQWTSSNPSVATVDADGNVTGLKKGSAVITCTVLDGCGKTAKCTVTVIQQATSIQISGPSMLACGKSASYTATPDTAASNKKVIWSVIQDDSAQYKATINNGKLSVPSGYAEDSLKVKAVSADGYGAEQEYMVQIIAKEANDVVITTDNEFCHPVRNAKSYNRVTAVTIASKDMPATENSDNTVQLNATLYAKDKSIVENDVAWTSSNTKVATVDSTGLVIGMAKGSAVITCAAQDGSNKKSTVKVNVSEPVSMITITGNSMITRGKTVTYTTTVSPSGATNKKVNWSVVSDATPNATINNGKLTVPIGYSSDSIQIQATAADGFGTTSDIKTITVKPAEANDVVITTDNSYCSPVRNAKSYNRVTAVTIASKDMPATENSDNIVQFNATLYAKDKSIVTNDVAWTSSNTKIATVDSTGLVTGMAKGSAVITCAAQDGSNKKSTVKVNVTEPVSGITLQGSAYAVAGKTSTFKAVLSPASAGNKNVLWSVTDNGSYPKATISNGKLVIPSGCEEKDITVTAVAKDNFGATSSMQVHVWPTTQMIVYTSDSHCNPQTNAKLYDSVTGITLTSLDLPETTSVVDNKATLNISFIKNGAVMSMSQEKPFSWTSSNKNIVTVDENGNVEAKASGKATLTCSLLDGSNQKATVTVNVTTPASSVEIVSPVSTMCKYPFISIGKSVSHKVAFGDGYGKPTTTSKDVTWSIKKITGTKYTYHYSTDSTDTKKDIDLTNELTSSVLIGNTGTLSVKKTSTLMYYYDGEYNPYNNSYTYYDLSVEIGAKVKVGDNYVVEGTMDYDIVSPATYLKSYGTVVFYDEKTKCYTGEVGGYFDTDGWLDYTITSSNPYVCSLSPCEITEDDEVIYFGWDDEDELSYFVMSCNKVGTATVTMRANDGSNKTCSFKFKVTEDMINGGYCDFSAKNVRTKMK